MAEHVLAMGLNRPDKDALLILSDSGTETWRCSDLRTAVLGTATGLIGTGLKPGDIVLLRLGNTVDFPLSYLAALAAGMVPVPTSAALTEGETARIISDLSPQAILRAPEVACPDHPQMMSAQTLREFRTLPPAAFHVGDPNRLGYIIYTSGTSGRPRAVAHAHRAIWARRLMFDGWYGLRATDRVLHAGAFNWTYTLGTGLMDPWTIGATALIPAPGTAPAALPGLLAETGATIFAAAPGVYRQMLRQEWDAATPSLRHGLSAGEKLPDRVAQRWQDTTGTPIFEAYGMSECSTFISGAPGLPAARGALGRPQSGRRVALVDESGPVALGKEGTIAVHRDDPGLMLEYLNAPDETRLRFQGDWFLTGDQGVMDAQGHITYLGRNDDMMNAGGYRVSPIEVENILSQMPGITGVAATDVQIKDDTRVIAAFYTGPRTLDDAALQSYVTPRLARYKQPRLFIHLPDLPTGANGKILRRALRAQYEAKR